MKDTPNDSVSKEPSNHRRDEKTSIVSRIVSKFVGWVLRMIGGKAYNQDKKDFRTFYTSYFVTLIKFFSVVWLFLILSGLGKLAHFFSFMVIANTVIPIPTPPVILYIGKFYQAIVVAILGGIASALGCLLDYIIIGSVVDTKYFSKYQNSGLLVKSRRYFEVNGFLTLMFFALTPFPFEPVKVLAIISKYDIKFYALAISISRGLRYYILASVGAYLTINQIIVIAVAFIYLSVIKWKKKSL